MMPERFRLSALNRMRRGAFVAALGGVFEHAPWVADAAWPAAPFATLDALHATMRNAVETSPPERQLELIQGHPDLAGKAARAGAMTAASVAEQSSAGLLSLDDSDYQRFHRLNTAYRARFGFPFIVAVRRHTKDSLLDAFETRLGAPRETEIATALSEIYAITRLRLDMLVEA